MTVTTLNRNGDETTFAPETAEYPARELPAQSLPHTNGKHTKVENRLRDLVPARFALNGDAAHGKARPSLAVFCHEDPESVIGQYVGKTVAALARRHIPVHLFVPQIYPLDTPGVSVHPVGQASEGDLLAQVQEFTRQACNAFLEQFPVGCDKVTLLGYEWSSVPALSLLHGIKNVDMLLSLHSLERQRSDLTSIMSKQIEDIELSGLREAKSILIQDPASAEIVKYWAPDCGSRMVYARQPFPAHHFASDLDPGAVKARYQVGPVDPTVLFVGDLDERYGPELLIKAMPAVLKNNKQVRLIVVGDGALYWPLRVYTRYLLLEHAVRLVGPLQGQPLYELIQAADLIAVPSREQTPWWPIQAGWAAQRPVVATHDAAPTLLEHEQDSVLCYASENSCVWGIERVLFDDGLGKRIAQKGCEKLEERFGWNSVAEQVEELLGTPVVS
jgi:glycosyltransferase involved in cell wall biosynthesis